MRILLVEDDQNLGDTVSTLLQEEGYLVDRALQGDEGLFLARQNIYDLLILDVMLPGMSGLAILKQLREEAIVTPILFLTARDSIQDKVCGLESGADDYLVKPFAFAELLARIKVLLRRQAGVKESSLVYGSLSLDIKRKEAFMDSRPLGLTGKEYELLEFLILNKEQILVREQIFDRIWGFESEATQGIVDLYIHYLRKKLAPFGCDGLIHTIRGVGFMLKA
ncbi:MAG: response regulator transcription factor [Sporomusaceae bacterium]|nr:response regulator transcription factor [Sporomusaceae bacterium]